MKRIAVTGGIAEGKSTVLGYLEKMGYLVASADVVAREIFEQEETQAEISALIGATAPVGSDQVRQAIGSRPGIRRELNRMMHPRILRRIQESPAQFVEVPLLIEACLQGEFDQVWVVTCGREEQFRRLEARVGKGEAVKLLGMQLPSEVKEVFADCVIRTNRAEEVVLQEVRAFARRA